MAEILVRQNIVFTIHMRQSVQCVRKPRFGIIFLLFSNILNIASLLLVLLPIRSEKSPTATAGFDEKK